MTKAELLGLKWSDIDFENQTIYVNRTLVYVTCRDEASPKYGKKKEHEKFKPLTPHTLISEMSKFEAEESEKGVNRQIGVKVV